MNRKMIVFLIGSILCIEAVFIIPVFITALIYHEDCFRAFFWSFLVYLVVGIPLVLNRPKKSEFTLKEGYIAVALGWVCLSLFGALPFIFSNIMPSIVDCFFESVSGFTTTGATILDDVDAMPHAINLWRCLSHWIGGMGILVFIMAVIPMLGGSSMNLMKAESSGPAVTRIMPTAKKSARWLYIMYISLTVIQIIILLISRMPFFDALTITLSTAGTGGFAAHTASCEVYTTAQQIIINVFMMIFSINFTAFFFIIQKRFKDVLRIEEVRAYLIAYAAAVAVIAFSVRDQFDTIGEAVQQSAFQTASIATSSGFSTMDYGNWPTIACVILVMFMLIGSTSGSTGCGIKFVRVLILVKTIKKELLSYIYPGSVKQIRLDGHKVEDTVSRSVYAYMSAYVIIFVISMLAISVDGFDFISTFTATAGCLSNIGPGFGVVGPAGNYAGFSVFSKVVLIFDMIAGRLEIFPLLMLFIPRAWKKF